MRTVVYAATAFGLVAVVVCVARALGFVAISDDDYCRITIAQRFALAPRLDPSGTSWLPFPFWLLGASFVAFGRTLAVARAAAPIFATLALAPWLHALRRDRGRGLLALALALAVDWVAWTSATPVPEALVGPMIAAPFLADEDDSPWAYAPFLWAATLARYEAWPLALAAAALWLARLGIRAIGPAVAAVSGIVGWLAWNAFAHGDALHFLARVQRYADAHGHEGARLEALLVYPRALVGDGRALGALAGLAVVAALSSRRGAGPRALGPRVFAPRSLAAPVLGALALIAFLELGAWRSGVPTHHAVRALLPLAWLAATVAARGLGAIARRRGVDDLLLGVAAVGLVAACGRFAEPPGRGKDDRSEALRLGVAAGAEGAPSLRVASCAFEHFATMATYGAPERVTVIPQRPGGPCPERLPEEGQAPKPELR